MEQAPHPSRLDRRDPAKADVRDVREEVDREIDAYARDLHDLVLLVPEDRWAEFMLLTGGPGDRDETRYRGVTMRKGAVTAVVAQEGF